MKIKKKTYEKKYINVGLINGRYFILHNNLYSKIGSKWKFSLLKLIMYIDDIEIKEKKERKMEKKIEKKKEKIGKLRNEIKILKNR